MIQSILKGISTYSDAFSHISKHRLWIYILLPGLLCIVLGAAVISFAYGLSDDLGGLIDNWWRWDFGRSVIEKIAQVFGGILLLAVGAIVFKQLIMVILSPFMSILSAKVEEQLTGIVQEESSFSIGKAFNDIARGLRLAVRNIFRELLATAFLFILGLIPVLTPFTTGLIFLIQSYYAGFGNTDYALERRFGFRDSVRYMKRNRGVTIGNGIIFMLLFLSVVGFLFALPLGTVAATIQTVNKLENE